MRQLENRWIESDVVQNGRNQIRNNIPTFVWRTEKNRVLIISVSTKGLWTAIRISVAAIPLAHLVNAPGHYLHPNLSFNDTVTR